jgi:bifunctional non-homologous end joining protein LigD
VAEIEFRGWTEDGLVRQAAFKGLREDKPPREIRREAVPGAPEVKRPVVHVELTHPERILWPDTGLTKQGLADFYIAIAKWILPHVTGRVLSLVRCPSGVGKDCFYAKHPWQGAPSSLRRIDVGEKDPMMAVDDLDGLIALVQSGVLEIHPWGSRIDDIERPDRIIFDLDPGPGVSWLDVIEAARDVRARLTKMKLKSFVKTSGGKGLHVVVPFTPQDDWDTVKEFTRLFAEKMAEDDPDRYIATATKAKRHGRIFIDYLRNGRGATAVAAYSTRARPGAAVSTPISWDELTEAIGPSHFTVDNLPQRLDHLDPDPWAEMAKLKQKLPRM